MPQLWLLAGGNGAGKSTFYKQFLAHKGIPFVNADIIARSLFPDNPEEHSYQAAAEAEIARNRYVEAGTSFCFETVFSHPTKIDFVGKAKAAGYTVILVFIHVTDSTLNQARISQRVMEGGHDVPADKVKSRIPRTLEHVATAIPLCDRVMVYDNSSRDEPFVRVASIAQGKPPTVYIDPPLPDWLTTLIPWLHTVPQQLTSWD